MKISEDDTRSAVLCRGGVTFVDKMDQFPWRALSVDNTPSYLNSEYSVKRCDAFNFHRRLRISRRRVYQRICHPKLQCGWAAIKGGGSPTRRLPHAKILLVPISFFPLLSRLCFGRFYIFTGPLFSHSEVIAHISIYCGFCSWSAGFALWCKSIFLDLFWSVELFITVE